MQQHTLFVLCRFASFAQFLFFTQTKHALETLFVVFLYSGDTLFQMAEVHRQIQVQLEDVVSIGKMYVIESMY